MSTTISSTSDPPIFITEPLRSSAPEKLENGDIRMAIAVAGQSAYNAKGERKVLSEKFLSSCYFTWENGLISTNHENTNSFLGGATLYDLEYDSEKKLVIASFSNLSDKARRLINSEFYQGVSQECIPEVFSEDLSEVVSGRGTGCTIVMWPHKPAASQDMGVGVRPVLASILSQKYPIQIDDTMSEKTGGGPSAISTEAYESIALEKVVLRSQIQTLETEKKTLETELASWKTKYSELESGEAQRIEIAISEDRAKRDAEFKAKAELDSAKAELKTVMSEEAAGKYLATNPTIEQIKSIAAIMKVSASKGVGSSAESTEPPENYGSMKQEWDARLGRV